MEIGKMIKVSAKRAGDTSGAYSAAKEQGLGYEITELEGHKLGGTYRVKLVNNNATDFCGVVHIRLTAPPDSPKFFMPGYMYNTNTGDMPNSGRKSFPRIRRGAEKMPESEYFMTRSDRLAEPVSLMYEKGHILGISAAPTINNKKTGVFERFCGFSCNINDNGMASVGYTLGYENAPWLFIQSATVVKDAFSEKNYIMIKAGESLDVEVVIYDYRAENELGIHEAIKDVYSRYHEAPRKIGQMDTSRAVKLLTEAIRDYAYLPDKGWYTGFVYDRPEGPAYNYIPSITWTNGLAVAVPMLLASEQNGDVTSRKQSVGFIDYVVNGFYNKQSGFLYESEENGCPTVKGWWYDGMHNGGHSGYLNGQAVYYILTAYEFEKEKNKTSHDAWLSLAGRVAGRMNEVINTDFEYPFSMSERTGAGLEYDSMGSAWCLAAAALYEKLTGDGRCPDILLSSEKHYYDSFVKKAECYGGPLDTDKAVDSEGVLGYIRAVRILHEITKEEYLLDHLRDALYYEYTFKLGYNTHIEVRPLSELGWSSCGGSITSTANPHIHPMSSTVVSEMRYYLDKREDSYIRSRMEDTIDWGLQTFNTVDGEYGYGKPGWMSERFCFCQGLLTEHYPDGEVASTWFALMPWASGSIIEGFVR